MIALALMTAPVLVQPFAVSPPWSTRLALALPARSRRTPCPASHRRKTDGCRRRDHLLYSSKSVDDDGDETPKESQASDAALFAANINSNELSLSDSRLIYGDDDDEDGDFTEGDPYAQIAPSEFSEEDTAEGLSPSSPTSLARSLAGQSRKLNISPLDWGGALSTLRSRVADVESGRSVEPAMALFRAVSRDRPNEAIGRFVREANPEVVSAMTGAVTSLLGSLSSPAMGVEMLIKASGEKVGSLCFQLMMTGYMFRNAEYVVALKSLMNIRGEGATLEEYRAAFRRFDTDGSGYLERDEIEAMLADVYDGQPPAFEITTFLEFFDANNDGRVSWEEFEQGFGVVTKMGDSSPLGRAVSNGLSLPGSVDDEEEDEEDMFGEPTVTGTVQVEMEDGRTIEVDAQEYINNLKQQALELKRDLAQEKGIDPKSLGLSDENKAQSFDLPNPGSSGGIATYVASLQGDVKSLTQGISPEVVDSMKMLINFVLEGTPGGDATAADKKKEMELPGSALQQLALWQLVIGYRLRETEATGDWRKMLE